MKESAIMYLASIVFLIPSIVTITSEDNTFSFFSATILMILFVGSIVTKKLEEIREKLDK